MTVKCRRVKSTEEKEECGVDFGEVCGEDWSNAPYNFMRQKLSTACTGLYRPPLVRSRTDGDPVPGRGDTGGCMQEITHLDEIFTSHIKVIPPTLLVN